MNKMIIIPKEDIQIKFSFGIILLILIMLAINISFIFLFLFLFISCNDIYKIKRDSKSYIKYMELKEKGYNVYLSFCRGKYREICIGVYYEN